MPGTACSRLDISAAGGATLKGATLQYLEPVLRVSAYPSLTVENSPFENVYRIKEERKELYFITEIVHLCFVLNVLRTKKICSEVNNGYVSMVTRRAVTSKSHYELLMGHTYISTVLDSPKVRCHG